MLFVAEYELDWETFEIAAAKRLEWDEERPEDFRYIGEYVWADRDPPFRGVVIFEADGVASVNAFILHYGPSLRMRCFPASDVVSAIRSLTDEAAPAKKPTARKRRSRA